MKPVHERLRELGDQRVRESYCSTEVEALADEVFALERALADEKEDAEEWHGIAQANEKIIYDVQEALDMRCVSNPKQVGCSDLFGTEPEVARALRTRMEAAERVVEAAREWAKCWGVSTPEGCECGYCVLSRNLAAYDATTAASPPDSPS